LPISRKFPGVVSPRSRSVPERRGLRVVQARAAAPAAARTGAAARAGAAEADATHRFELTPEGGDIVGYVQKTAVARTIRCPISPPLRRGVRGAAAREPGVDPWLPGVGREVVLPTQFVLPAAPHEVWW